MANRKASAQNSTLIEEQNEIEAMMEKMFRDLCTTAEAAEILGVKDRQIRVLISTKKISAVCLKNLGWVVYKPSLAKYSKTKSSRGRPPSGTTQSQEIDLKTRSKNT
jgi:hypothetical protein